MDFSSGLHNLPQLHRSHCHLRITSPNPSCPCMFRARTKVSIHHVYVTSAPLSFWFICLIVSHRQYLLPSTVTFTFCVQYSSLHFLIGSTNLACFVGSKTPHYLICLILNHCWVYFLWDTVPEMT